MENPKLNQKHNFLDEILRLVETLRGENGCPWDRKQTPESVSVYLIEEVFELMEALQTGDPEQVCEELGDVLFQIVFIARMFQERDAFDIFDVVRTVTEKMIRRHPHVFGDKKVNSSAEVVDSWHKIKLDEKKSLPKRSALDSVPVQLPALLRAYRISARAAQSGFEWMDAEDAAADKIPAQLIEISDGENRESPRDASRKFGDLLFVLVNIARQANVHPETALAGSVKRFEQRFKKMEDLIHGRGQEFTDISGREKTLLWRGVKKRVGPENG